MRLLVAPAGGGKTRAAWRFALEKTQKLERVIVLTLPNQRPFWLEGLAKNGSSLGIEVTNLQNLCYKMLDRLGQNKGVVLNPGRVALTARALEQVLERPASEQVLERPASEQVLERAVQPGEARLYAQAIAECKRNLFVPLGSIEPYQNTLSQVYAAYNGLLEQEDLQDLDDVRLRAAALLSEHPIALGAHLVVDGYRSLNASELGAIVALSKNALSSLLTLPGGSPDTSREYWAHPTRPSDLNAIVGALGAKPERLDGHGKPWAGLPQAVQVRPSANPVSEARAALRQLKLWLLEGTPAHQLALVVSSHTTARVLEALAKEYHLPLAPESSGALLESVYGRVLDAALTAPVRDFPAAELRVLSLVLPALEGLAETLERRGLHGGSSPYRVLTSHLEEAWRVLDDLKTWTTPPQSGFVEWFEALLLRLIPQAPWLETARVLAREAARLLGDAGGGAQFAEWLRTLLSAASLPHPETGRGVAVLTPPEASGRRFEKIVVLGAVEGAYQNSELEDFFIPEETRADFGLPLRMNGLSDSTLYDVLTRASTELVVSYPKAERGASLTPHPRLAKLGVSASPELRQTAGLLELSHSLQQQNTAQNSLVLQAALRQAPFAAQELERVAQCGLRAWAWRWLPKETAHSLLPSLALARLKRSAKLETAPEELQDNLQRFDPTFVDLLHQQLEQAAPNPMQPFLHTTGGVEFVLEGLQRRKDANGKLRLLEIYRFVEDVQEGWEAFRDTNRHREWWFADIAIESGVRVAFCAVDGEGKTKNILNPEAEKSLKRRLESRKLLAEAKSDLEHGVVRVKTGFHCRSCAYQDLCRAVTD
jgi:hypothetical protein